MPQSPTYDNFRAQAAYALEGVRYYHAWRDRASVDHWHAGTEDDTILKLAT